MRHFLLSLFLFALPQSSDPPALPPEVAALVRSGIEAENRHDEDAAIAAFRKASEAAPNSAVVFFRLGSAYMKNRDYSSAVAPLKRAAELNPEAPAVHQMLGFALLSQGYSNDAIPHLEKAHEFGALGVAQLQSGRPEEALANFQLALANSPGDPDLLYYLSKASDSLAAQFVDKLLATAHDSARAHQILAQHYFSIKSYPEARKEYEAALAQRPALPGLRLELGQVFAASSQWPEAEEQFRAEARLQPGSAEAAFRLGASLLQQGKMKEAAAVLERSNELRPDMSETLYALGRALAVSNPTAAAKSLIRVTEIERDSPLAAQAFLALAGLHRKLGSPPLADRDMQEYRRITAKTQRSEHSND
jgi:tetratricopeptide (TPR) repeat protein